MPLSSRRHKDKCPLQDGPGDAAVAALGHASETPERLWNLAMAMTTAEEVASLAASARLAQVFLPMTPHRRISAMRCFHIAIEAGICTGQAPAEVAHILSAKSTTRQIDLRRKPCLSAGAREAELEPARGLQDPV